MTDTSKIWFITGASQGFGRVTTERVLQAGNIAIATMRRPEVFADLQAKYPADNLLVLKVDVTKQEDVDAAFAKAKETFGRIDVVFNNAGFAVAGEIEATPLDEAKSVIETNFWGAIRVTRAAVQFFREVNKPAGGYLLQNSSIQGRKAYPAMAFYSASKFALEAASEALYQELDPDWNIKVLIIEPGSFRTNYLDTGMKLFRHPAYSGNPELPGSQTAAFFAVLKPEMVRGDPSKLTDLLFKLVEMDKPPLRVLAGKDAWKFYEENEAIGKEERERFNIKAWSDDLEYS